MVVLVLVAALVGGVAYLIVADNPCNGFPFQSTVGVGLAEHYHAQLLIFINDQQVNLPVNIGEGDSGACTQPLHVHQTAPNTNVIHIESPTLRNFTLGDFFAVWKASPGVGGLKPVALSSEQLFNYTAGNGYEIRMHVNGQQSTSFGGLVLQGRMTVVLVYGRSANTQWATYQTKSAEPWPYSGY